MSTFFHILFNLWLVSRFTYNPILYITVIILSARPDVIRLLQKDKSDWTTYNECHKMTLSNMLIPFSNDHILMDYYCHQPTGEWKPWVLPLEICLWIIYIILYIYCPQYVRLI
jgi:hypothetical protein